MAALFVRGLGLGVCEVKDDGKYPLFKKSSHNTRTLLEYKEFTIMSMTLPTSACKGDS